MATFPAHDPGNPISNEDGRFLQEVAERPYGPVSVDGVVPDTISQGETGTDYEIVGTGFAPNPTVSVSGSGVSVSSVVRASDTSIMCTFTVTGGAAATSRSVTVTNAHNTTEYDHATKSGALTVTT